MPVSSIGKQLRNRIIWYCFAMVMILSLISLSQQISETSIDSYYILALILVIALGIIHVRLMYKYLQFPLSENFGRPLLITIIIMALSAVIIAVIYYFLKLNYGFITFLLPFIIPFICYRTYQHFIQIPSAEYKLWYYPVNSSMPDIDAIDLSQVLVVQFVFSKSQSDLTKTNFTAKAPINMTMGQLFFIFINDYNEREQQGDIAFLNSQNLPYGWLFYCKKGWLNKKTFFDTDLSFKDNFVHSNEFIYADRVTN